MLTSINISTRLFSRPLTNRNTEDIINKSRFTIEGYMVHGQATRTNYQQKINRERQVFINDLLSFLNLKVRVK